MSLALSTDLYELTMMAGYHTAGLMPRATFDLYVRELPPNRSFLIAAGLEQALDYLEQLRFSESDIEHLRALPALQGMRPDFFDEYLPRFRFTGDVWAADEGTPMFPPAPLLRVTAPLPEAQLVETGLLAHLGFQTSVASRAARIVHAAAGRAVVEFGARRAHGIEAGVLAARAAFLSGCASTSNVEAGRRFGIPVSGTMAHSWVMSFADEAAAFRQFSDVFGGDAVLLLDTYDTLEAARSVVAAGLRPRAVRLDSGDLIALAGRVRAILDAGGLRDTRTFVSGDLDEWRIDDIVRAGAPVDGFGVGAALSTVSDAPSLGAIYKLVEIDREGGAVPVMKRSAGKQTHPGRKQVWRIFDGGAATEDVIELAGEALDVPEGQPLLKQVMSGGRRVHPSPLLDDLRTRSQAALAALPESVRRLHQPVRYNVRFGRALRAMVQGLKPKAQSLKPL
ncbi:MAG: nicotinate phosphoribosyltransferase [Vicinamibacterales bacterium]